MPDFLAPWNISSGEGLIGASIWVTELGTRGITNEHGFLSLTMPEST